MSYQIDKNLASSTLASGYTAGNTTLTLQTGDGSKFSASGNFVVALGTAPDFFLLCTSRSGDTLTVGSSGVEGTAAVNESSGCVVTQVITSATLVALLAAAGGGGGGNKITLGTYAGLSSVTGMNSGDNYKCTDAPYEFVYTGSIWAAYYSGYPVTLPPLVSSLTWVNQGTATANNNSGGLWMQALAAGGDNEKILAHALPTPPWSIVIGFQPNFFAVSYDRFGFVIRDTGSGRGTTFCYQGPQGFSSDSYNSPTSYGGNSYNNQAAYGIVFFKIQDDGTNFTWSVSRDGQNFSQIYQVGRTSWLASPNQVGVFVDANNGSCPCSMYIFHWLQGT